MNPAGKGNMSTSFDKPNQEKPRVTEAGIPQDPATQVTSRGATTDEEAAAFVASVMGAGHDGAADAAPASVATGDRVSAGDAVAADVANGGNDADTRGGNGDNGHGAGAHAGDSGKSPANTETDPKTALAAVLAALAEALPPEPEPPTKKQKVSPARRRAEAQKRVTVLRGMARTRRTALTAQREAEEPDADAIRQLEAELEVLDKQLTEAEDELAVQLERAARRADRDRDLRTLETDPNTGKRWARTHQYDPRSDEMKRLYGEKTLTELFVDGGKLIRSDGGKYGREGGVIRALLQGAQWAGETLSSRLLMELTKAVAWDIEERVHGMGAGYCRITTWALHKMEGAAFDLTKAPKRDPLAAFDGWVAKQFEPGYAEALTKLCLDDCDPNHAAAGAARGDSTEGE
jgi:hypothetical protein